MNKRIFGATDGIRGKVGEWPLQPAAVRRLGEAVAEYFGGSTRLLVGRDTRASGVWMLREFRQGAEQAGAQIADYGVLPTPALSVLVRRDARATGGVMMTASHNPASDNGLKVFGSDGDKLSDAEELKVEERYFAEPVEETAADLVVSDLMLQPHKEAMEQYIAAVRDLLGELRLSGDLLYDAAAGAGQYFDKTVLEAFGLRPELLSPEPDGENINRDCGALYPEHLARLAQERGVAGVTMDGDADRVVLVDELGRIWDGDRELAVLAQYLQEKGELASNTVVVTEYTNLGLIKYFGEKGIAVEKVVNGDRFVAQKCAERGYVLGGESSGHIIYLPWLNSSDGVFVTLLMLKIAQEKGGRLADLWPDYEAMPSRQWGLAVREKRELAEVAGWQEALTQVEQTLAGRGRVFCRYSGTENKLRILVEGADADLVERCGEKLAEIVRKEIGDD